MNTYFQAATSGRSSVDRHLNEVIRSGRWPQIGSFVTTLLRAESFDELHRQFRRAILHFGYFGFAYWGAGPSNRFSLCGMSDLTERFGKHTSDCGGLMATVFNRHDPALRARDNDWKTQLNRPLLECADAPVETRDIHRDICNSVRELGFAPYEDVLIVPTGTIDPSASTDERNHVHLPLLSGVGAADIVAGISLTKIFDTLAEPLINNSADTANAKEPGISLAPKEKAVLHWAAHGKTHQEIADKTGLRRGEVRYYLEKARKRYGFATNIQTIVQAAKDHGWFA